MAGNPSDAVTPQQYGELEVKVIKLRRALAHAQSVTKRQDAALSKTIDRLQILDEEVKELKDEGNRLEDEIQYLEDELDQRKTLPEMSQKDYTEKEIEDARREIEDLRFERAKVMVEVEKQKLCNREVGKTVEIIRKRYDHEDKKRRHEIRKLDEKEKNLKKEIDKLRREKNQLQDEGINNSQKERPQIEENSRSKASWVSRKSSGSHTDEKDSLSRASRHSKSRSEKERSIHSSSRSNRKEMS
mmetsp:Transcript_7822/g.8973  ORF Transcript_7822/g.8973 Transcript_7822/m.8973 type:complete len:244 (+) Transcript_7822:190-921(+)|eukprot:CAMPEP_0194132570 /NCGR_PEP_ID=MMETSP0152-20130528/3008_1 /TAXON_ID=1049557 /ORGANISM="Thalassiothrix antarctica, Strain L6-D1" /LENGTH=243 /DNA_ID=CAMNT_0038827665 /DNA_START=190 /DNA_END=921 /DNA_ORIENTATION=+